MVNSKIKLLDLNVNKYGTCTFILNMRPTLLLRLLLLTAIIRSLKAMEVSKANLSMCLCFTICSEPPLMSSASCYVQLVILIRLSASHTWSIRYCSVLQLQCINNKWKFNVWNIACEPTKICRTHIRPLK